jgi:hypothetical protein
MKTKTVLLIGVASFLVGLAAGGFLGKSKGPDPQYWVSREDYDQAAKDMEEGLQNAFAIIDERDKTIRLQNEFVALGQRKIIELESLQAVLVADGNKAKAETALLKRDASAAIAASPAVKALVDNFELRCENYENQVLNLSLSGKEKDGVIEAQAIQIVALAYQRDTWKKAWEDEHALRVVGDNLRLDLEHQYRASKFWAGVGKWGPPIAFALGLVIGK